MHITDSCLGHEIDGTLLSVTIYQYYVHSYVCTCICIYLSTCILIFFITKMYLWFQITQSGLVFQQCYNLLIYWCFFFPAHYYSMSKIWMMFISSYFALLITLLKSTYSNIGTVYINKCHGNASLLCMIIFIDWLRALDW